MQGQRRFGWNVVWLGAFALAATAPVSPRGGALDQPSTRPPGREGAAVAGALSVGGVSTGGDSKRGVSASGSSRVTATMARLPLRFEANAGQWDERVRFATRQGGLTLFLTDDGMTFALTDVKRPAHRPGSSPHDEREARERAPREAKHAAVSMKLVGSKPTEPRGDKDLVTKSNFFLGNDRSKWRTNVPNFAEVRAKGWLRGVDVVWHGRAGGLEYDLEVDAGVDAQSIELAVDGAKSLAVAEDGALQIHTAAGTLVQKPPRVVQDGRELTARYVLSAPGRVRFEIDRYDARLAVLVDPMLAYSTYLGGGGGDSVAGVAVDGSGNAYVVGYTLSTDFPTANALQPTYRGGSDAFVAKLNTDGSALVYATYLGGTETNPVTGISGQDDGKSIAVDGNGNAYVVGFTRSPDFPRVNALQPTCGGGVSSDFTDAFVAKLSSDGSALIYSTFLGGADEDHPASVAVDGSGNAYVVGYTWSLDFPTANAMQPTNSGSPTPFNGPQDAFVAKVNPAGSALVYSTYLGGTGFDSANGVAVDGSGNAYVVGDTSSTNFATPNAVQPTLDGYDDAFVVKLNPAGSSVVYSTFLGGGGHDRAQGVAVDGSGNAYVVGSTTSTNFPTANALQPGHGGAENDGFVAKLNPAGSALVYSTYLGGGGEDSVRSVAVDGDGNAYVVGGTSSPNLPTANALQPAYAGASSPLSVPVPIGDAFVAKLSPAGSALVFSTYLGGSAFESADGVAVDGSHNVYVVGGTNSPNLPTANALQPTPGASGAAFIAKLVNCPAEPCPFDTPPDEPGTPTGSDGDGTRTATPSAAGSDVTGGGCVVVRTTATAPRVAAWPVALLAAVAAARARRKRRDTAPSRSCPTTRQG